jgi:mono/diheme cytochrome c family protein
MLRTIGWMTVATMLGAAGAGKADEPPTYAGQVARILYAHCVSCHRPGEVAPFPLMTYQDAARKADTIARMVERRRMPPWRAEPQEHAFLDERRLSDQEVRTIVEWAKAGAPLGEDKRLPPRPAFSSEWSLGEPDLVLTMPQDVTIPAEGRDVYRCVVIPSNLLEDRTVAAVDFRPSNRAVVHHALFFLDNTGKARALDEKDPEPGYRSFGGVGFVPSGALGGWAPGATFHRLPEGVGRMMHKGSDVVLQMHYHPTGKVEQDRSTIAIYFTRKPADQLLIGLPLGTRNIDIPAGESRHHLHTELTLPVGVTVYGATPHMHWVGREMIARAILPDGKTIQLIHIREWDFDWQDQYSYARPLSLPRGTKLTLDAWYDNSSGNPRNPSNPPQRVRHGEQTTNEMCYCFLNVVPDSKLGYFALLQAVDSHYRAERAKRKQVGMAP